MANTVIQLKYSNLTSVPPSLNVSEPAYSNVSNKLWINDGDGVVAIGGKYYTQLIDTATAEGLANTIVRRSVDGHFNGNRIYANTINANTAVIQNGYNLYEFANAAFTQANTAIIAGGEIAGGYANSAYAQANIATQYAQSAGSYANSAFHEANNATSLASDALQHAASAGSYANSAFIKANSAFAHSNLTQEYASSGYAHANAAYDHANTKFASAGGTISGDVTVTGNLTISGEVTTVSANNLSIQDNMIYLNDGANVAYPDLGFAGAYNDGTYQHTGLFRDESDGIWKFYDGYTLEPDASIYIDTTHPSFRIATLTANIITDVISVREYDPLDHANNSFDAANVADQRAVTSGDYANSAYAQANIATQYAESAGSYANSAYVQANTGTSLAQAAFDAANSSLGGTATDGFARNTANAASSYANSAYIQANTATQYAQSAGDYANAAFAVANTDVTNVSTTAGNYGSASVVPSFRVEANGRISSISTSSIAIDASAITTGTLGVSRGGTGNTSFTANHVILGNGTGALTTVGSSTEGHILTISDSGVPVFQHLNGGTF